MAAIDTNTIASGQAVEFDFLRPGDAEGVAALFHAVYGENYPHQLYYDPKGLSAENAAGRTISSVARTAKGDIVGHTALFQIAPFPGLYESGAGLVLPSYRHGVGIFKRIIAHSFEVVPKQFPIEAIFGDVILNHPYTQRTSLRQKSIPMGVQVDLIPVAPYVKEGSASGRVASLVTINIYRPHPHKVHTPAAYHEILADLYRGLNDQRELVASSQAAAPGSASRMESQYYGFAQVARVLVFGVGEDFGQRFEAEENAALGKGAIVLQAWLDLSEPCVGAAVDWLRGRGYFLGGLVPRWFGSDALFLQKLLHKPHWEGIVMELERGKQLLAHVRGDWEASQG